MPRIYRHYITYKSPNDFTILNNFFYNREMDLEDPEKSEDESDPWITYFFTTPYPLDEDERHELFHHEHCIDAAFNRYDVYEHRIHFTAGQSPQPLHDVLARFNVKAPVEQEASHVALCTLYTFRTEYEIGFEQAIKELPGVYRVSVNNKGLEDLDEA